MRYAQYFLVVAMLLSTFDSIATKLKTDSENHFIGNILELDKRSVIKVLPKSKKKHVESSTFAARPLGSLSITSASSTNCTGSNPYTAEWNIVISASGGPDNNISYQRNSDAILSHVLTGTTASLSITNIPADGGASDTLKVWFTNDPVCADTLILNRPLPCPPDLPRPVQSCNFLDFDGTNDFATIPDNALFNFGSFQDFSIELKVKTTGWTSDAAIISDKDWSSGANDGFVIAGNTDATTWKVNLGDGSNRVDLDGHAINDNLWHHLAVTFNRNGNIHIYQDGLLINHDNMNDILNVHSGLPINIAQDGTGSLGYYFDGQIDDVRIWSTVLSGQDIYDWSTKTVDNTHPEYANLLGQWLMEEGTGTTVADETANANTMTISGATWTTASDCPNYFEEASAFCSNVASSSISGNAWEDDNYNGLFDEVNPSGVQGVEVYLYDDCGSLSQSTHTDSKGYYEFTSLNIGTTYRVEFVLPPAVSSWANPTGHGTDNATNVQFVQAGNCAHFGLGTLTGYCNTFVETLNVNEDNDNLTLYKTPNATASSFLYYNATNEYATIPDVPLFDFGATQDFTLELRVKTSYWSGDPAIMSDKDWASGSNDGFNIHVTGGTTWALNIGDGSNRVDLEGGYIEDDDWHLLTVSVDRDGDVTIYQDGVESGRTSMTSIGNIHSGLPIRLAQDGTGSYGTPFVGSIDEVRIWNAALSSQDIQAWTCSEITPTHPAFANLLGYWKFNENTGTTSADETANDNDITISNPTWQVEATTPLVCSGDKYIVRNCFGTVQSIPKNFLNQPNKSYALHGTYDQALDHVPTCMIYTNEFGEIQDPQWAYCLDETLGAGTLPELMTNWDISNDARITGLTDLQSTRLAWILENYETLGFNLTNSTSRRHINEGVWAITDPATYTCDPSDPWYSLCNGARTAVTSVPPQPSLTLDLSAGHSAANQLGTEVQYDLTAANSNLLLTVSKGGAMPVLCNGSELAGHTITDNGDGTGTLTFSGAGPYSVNLCLTRNAKEIVELRVTDPSVLSDGSDMKIMRPKNQIDVIQDYLFARSSTTASDAASAKWYSLPLEIGNYVWNDTDGNGLQNACESGIDGVTVELIKGGTVIATTQTTDGGQYYFSSVSASDPNLVWTGTGADTALIGQTTYTIRINNSIGGSQQIPLNGLILTTADANSDNSDNIDSDASLNVNHAEISVTLEDFGKVNHDLDFGFYPCIEPSAITTSQVAPTCTGLTPNNDGVINVTAVVDADRYAISTGAVYTGVDYATAIPISSLPFAAQINVPNTGGTYTIRFFNHNNACFTDETVTINAVTCICVAPSAIAFSQVAPTCSGPTANDEGSISLTAYTDGTHYSISSLNAVTYDGATTVATAMPIPSSLPAVIQTNIPNTGGSYIIRIFNIDDSCFTDETVSVNPVTCCTPPIVVSPVPTSVTTVGGTNGTLFLNIYNGVSGYTYNWDDGTTTGSGNGSLITGLPPGNYQITVTDNVGCTGTTTAEIEDVLCIPQRALINTTKIR